METLTDLLDKHPDQTKVAAVQSTARARVLIVDDEAMNIKLFKAYLSNENYEIITADNGHDALVIVRDHTPDVILLDIMMPDIDGFEVTRRLKQNQDTAGIPIILLTALSGDKNKSRGLEAGADEFLTKPIQKAELVARVGSMTRLKRFQEQLNGRQQSQFQLDRSPDGPTVGHQKVSAILIVEDDDKDALLLNKQLENEPFIIKRVTSGEAAIRQALEGSIDLMLLDVMLPGIDGFEVCKRLKSDDRTKNIQIIMRTSLHDLEYRIQGTDLGADDYLVKPVDPRELRARVKALLKKKDYIDKLHNKYERALNRAICDGLTGLYNHSHFRGFFELEIKRSARQNHPVSLLLLDLDNFKLVNDGFGHLVGDRVLIQVSKIIKNNIREIDFAARYGGEEFAVILPYTDIEEARDVAERVRQAVEQEATLSNRENSSPSVTVSIGAAFYPDDGMDIEAVVRKADEMMYLAKQCGKNQICVTSDYRR